ncbi:MAG: class I SAM-dependent methyltransferase [Patescibacteria group bacterium]
MKSAQFQLHAAIEESHWWFTAKRKILHSIISEFTPQNSGKRIVDIGCGTGANIAALANEYECTGIDPSADSIDLAKKRFPHVQFQCGDALRDFQDSIQKADMILLTDVLEHIEDDRTFLTKLIGVMKPNAHLLITVPADISMWSKHDEHFGHYRRYDRVSLEKQWQGLPVTSLLLSHFNSRLYPIIRSIRTMNRLLRRTSGKSGTDFCVPLKPANFLLAQIFAGETTRLLKEINTPEQKDVPYGASLMAVLRKNPTS